MDKNGVDSTFKNENFYLGSFASKILPGYRLIMPAAFRKKHVVFVLTRGWEGNILLFDIPEWQKILAPVEGLPFFEKEVRSTLRYLAGFAYEVRLDEQGRFVMPKEFRRFFPWVSPGKEIMFVGVHNWIEIWEKGEWEKQANLLEKEIVNITENLRQKISK